MFWSIVLPAKLTLGLFLAIIGASTLLAPLAGVRRATAFFSLTGLGMVFFIPSCNTIMRKIDVTRFGEFHYESSADITETHVAAYIPNQSSDIHTHQQPNGWWATFKIPESTLLEWVDRRWKRYGEFSVTDREGSDVNLASLRDEMMLRFRQLDWTLPDPDISFAGPTAADGATFVIWYNRETETGILWGCYW